jgi:hypothetical protein
MMATIPLLDPFVSFVRSEAAPAFFISSSFRSLQDLLLGLFGSTTLAGRHGHNAFQALSFPCLLRYRRFALR